MAVCFQSREQEAELDIRMREPSPRTYVVLRVFRLFVLGAVFVLIASVQSSAQDACDPVFGTQFTGGVGGFFELRGVAVDNNGVVHVLDAGNYRVQRLDYEGTYLGHWGGPWYFGPDSEALAVDPSGDVFVLSLGGEFSNIQKFTNTGSYVTQWGYDGSGDGGFSSPQAFSVDDAGFLYVADFGNHRVQVFDGSGTFVRKWGSGGTGDGQFSYPDGIAVRGGVVYVADDVNRIQKFDTIGTFLSSWRTTGNANDLIVDSDLNLHVVKPFDDRVEKYSPGGALLAIWGTSGSGDGEFERPTAIAVSQRGDLFITDTVLNRVQRFDLCRPTVGFPASPSQLISEKSGPFGVEYEIELRNDIYPQGLFIYFDIPVCCMCNGSQPDAISLIPRSGTGPVFPVRTTGPYQTYFEIDNLTAPGFYDLEVECAGGVRDTLRADVGFVGYQGYASSGLLVNSVTGNTIRGAGVSIWQSDGQGGFNLFESSVASDGTYFFDVPSGDYKILVEYELGGQHWTNEFSVNSPIPGGDIALTPVTNDTDPPAVQVNHLAPDLVAVDCSDQGVGIAVAEVVPGSVNNMVVFGAPFQYGDSVATLEAAVLDPMSPGSSMIRCEDTLGNSVEFPISLTPTAVGTTGPRVVLGQHMSYPNPFNPSVTLEFSLAVESEVVVSVYDLSGRLVRRLLRGESLREGSHRFAWNGRDVNDRGVSSGVYVYRIEASGENVVGRLILVK